MVKEYEDDLKNDYLELEDNIINYLKLDKIDLNKREMHNISCAYIIKTNRKSIRTNEK